MAVAIAAFSMMSALAFDDAPGITNRATLVHIRWGDALTALSTDEMAVVGAALEGSIASLAAESDQVISISLPSGPAAVTAGFVSARFFDTLGTRALAGRLLAADDVASRTESAVISARLWRDAFGNDPAVIGSTLRTGRTLVTIVGVAPDGFGGLGFRDIGQASLDSPQVWLPASRLPKAAPAQWLVAGRLAAGVSASDVASAVRAVGVRLVQDDPSRQAGTPMRAFAAGISWRGRLSEIVAVTGIYLFVPICVLAVGCANVLNLQLATATERTRELSVRLALGASRASLVRLLTLDVLPLAALAAALGWVGARALLLSAQALFPMTLALKSSAWVFTGLLVTGATAAAGLWPAWLATRGVSHPHLQHRRDDGVSHRRLRASLVISQVTAAVALLYLSLLGIQALDANRPQLRGDGSQILTAEFQAADLPASEERRRDFIGGVLERLASDPRVQAAGFADFVLFDGGFRVEAGTLNVRVGGGRVTPGWFNAAGVRLLAGQPLDDAGATSSSVVINEACAAMLGGADPRILGRVLTVAHPTDRAARQAHVVGIVSDHLTRPDGRPVPMMFEALSVPPGALALFARAADADAGARAIRLAVAASDPDVPWRRLSSLAARIGGIAGGAGEIARFGASLGVLALLLAAIGLHAVLSYAVRRRAHEMAVRVAVGATAGDIVRLVVRQAAVLMVIGGLCGLALGMATATALRSVMVGWAPLNPMTLCASVGALGIVGLLATVAPAVRAGRADPLDAMRLE